MSRHLSLIRVVVLIVLVSIGLGVSSPISAQEETPPPLLPTELVVVSPTNTLLPSETPTLEPTATSIPPTETATLETTAAPPTETPTLEPTLETTVEPTLEPTADTVTATPESTADPNATATVEPTVEFITATPEMLLTDEPTPTEETGRHRSTRVESHLLELEELVEEGQTAQAQSFATSMQLDVSTSVQMVHIEVVAGDAAEAIRLRPLIERLGGVFLIGYDRRMEFDFPITTLDMLERTEGNFAVIRPREARPMLGAKTSEGVQATGAAQWHQRGIDGTGVRIGVIDSGFSGYSGPETAGCVQTISNFAPGTTLSSEGNHGANVAQIICDMAPKAQVFLAQVSTLSSLNAAVDWMIAQNVQIVNMSLGWDFAGAGDGTGEVNTIVSRLTNNGILLVNAAGNENDSVWHGGYTSTTFADDGTIFGTGNFLNFGGPTPPEPVNVLFGGVTLDQLGCDPGFAAFIAVTLRWSDWNENRTGNLSGQNFDLHIYYSNDGGSSWNLIGLSILDQAIPSVTPVEGLARIVPCYDSFGNPLMYGVAVECYANCGTPYMQIIAARGGNLSIPVAGSSLTSPADSQHVLAVAAGEVKAMSGFPFSSLGYPDLAVYSSRGPILGAGGTAPTGGSYTKPDLTAPTNTTTSLHTSFNGTSAASPHAAGFAALVYQYNRAAYDALSGAARAQALKADLLNPTLFIRPAPFDSERNGCDGASVNCFGQGILTLDNEFFAFTDAKLEHTDGRITRSGAGWTVQTQTGASGGNYIFTKGTTGVNANFAQIEFGVTFASSVQVFFWQRPDLSGSVQIFLNGTDVTGNSGIVSGTTSLNAGTPTLASFTVNTTPYIGLNEITIRPGALANGLSLDYIQLQHGGMTTLQENDLTANNTFGTWSRVALAGASGGYHLTNNQRGAGVQFYTNAPEFTVTYTKRPDGGIMEIWVNGQLCTTCGEINTWSGNTLTSPQAVHYVNAGALAPFGAPPYFVQLINSGRQTPATTNRPYVTIDNIRFPAGGGLASPSGTVDAETGYTGQVTSQFLPMNGVWTNTAQASAFGGRVYNTTTAGAEFRFNTNANRVVVFYTGINRGGLIEIYVNGQLCTECGTIDTYRSTAMYKVPYFFTIPGTFTAPYHVTLRNTGRRNPSSTGTTMAIDRILSLNNPFAPLALFNVQATDLGSFWINERWVAQRQTDAIGTDVYINNHPYGGIFFPTCSRDFTLLLGKNPNGGTVRVKLWDDRNANPNLWTYITLAEFNGQATSTIWRYGLNVTIPTTLFSPSCPYTNGTGQTNRPFQILVEVDSNTQFGNTLDYGYVDALLINDAGALFGWGYTAQPNGEMYSNGSLNGDVNLLEIGPGWQNATTAVDPQTFAGSQAGNPQFVRRTNATSGASIQFTLNDPTPLTTPYRPRLIFNRMPDGGIAELFVNGIFQYEISFYSPVPLKKQFLPLTLPANIQFPAVIELRNVPRRTTGSTGYYMYIDALIETNEPTGFVAQIINNGLGMQNDSPNIQLFGATWTRSTNPPTTTVYPSGTPANIDTTTANSGGVRFILTGSNRFTFVSSASANRGIAEIWVNGRLCTACGTINTFRPQTFWRVPFLVEIPTSLDADPGAGQLYYVQIHTTNVRSTGATGFGLSADEIIPLNGGTIVASTDPLWTNSIVQEMAGSTYTNASNWSTVSNTLSYGGSHRFTSVGGNELLFDVGVEFNVSTDEFVILHHRSTRGGIAEIYVLDPSVSDLVLCSECGSINSYSPYTRYQAPFYVKIPTDRFGAGPWTVRIENSPMRPAGSTGNELALDAFILLP